MKKALSVFALLLALSLTACGSGGSFAPEEYSEGRIGDVMHNKFFDFTVNSAYTCATFEGYIPEEGRQLLVAELTIKNTFHETIPMFDTDFQAQWNDQEDLDNAYAYPVEEIVSDEQLAVEYDLGVDEETTGLLVFEVPAELQDYSVVYLEEFDDDSTGDFFAVFFTAKQVSAAV